MELIFEYYSKEEIKILTENVGIISDSGHGWYAANGSNDNTLKENDFNTAVESKICFILDNLGFEYTRLSPSHLNTYLNDRIKEEHKFHKKCKVKGKFTIGYSIHADWWKLATATGRTIFYYDNSIESQTLAEMIEGNIGVELNSRNISIHNRSVKSANYKMLRDTKSPFVLLEAGFMSNKHDLQLLKSDTYRNAIAIGIVKGILSFSTLKLITHVTNN